MHRFVAASLVLLLSACGQDETVTQTVAVSDTQEAQKHSGLLLENMNTQVRPGDDFNAYVNGTWMDTNEIPADRAANSVGLIVHEQATRTSRPLSRKPLKGISPRAVMNRKSARCTPLTWTWKPATSWVSHRCRPSLQKSPHWKTTQQLAVYFAEANKTGIDLPFALAQYVDFKDPNTYMMYTWQAGLGLPDREYYFTEDEKSVEIRQAYVAHVEKMLNLAGIANGAEAAGMIMALETRMAAEHMKKEQTRDMVALYNKLPLDELPGLMPDFAWDSYLSTAAIDGIDGLVVTQLDYMRALNDIIKDTSMDDWKTYLTWKALNANAHLLNEELDQQNFEFYSKTLRGIEQPLPRWKRAVANVNGNLGEVVGKVYVARHFPPEAKQQMLELVDNLIKAYEISIKELDWMGEETREQALDKLSKFTPKIGYPDNWEDYSKLEIKDDDLVGNMQRSAMFEYEKNLARQGGPVDRSEWAMTPQTVNAYYNPPLNEIVFPAAILQPPFFDLNADDAVNYGAIGAVIGHEIGHGFDDSGSTFDGDGVLRNWWTDEDKAEFENRTAKLVEQYSEFKPFEDLAVNGEFTLGENIGDLGGLSIALLAYELSLNGEEAPVLDGFTGVQRVFIGYAQAWLGKSRDEALREQIQTDPHSPRQYRVNGVVRNIPAFYEVFDVAETDALYLAPEDRVKIW